MSAEFIKESLREIVSDFKFRVGDEFDDTFPHSGSLSDFFNLQLNPVTVVLGPPGCGKTSLGVNILREYGEKGRNILFWTEEHDPVSITRRLLSVMAGIPINETYQMPDVESDNAEKMVSAIKDIARFDIRIKKGDGALSEYLTGDNFKGMDDDIVIIDDFHLCDLGIDSLIEISDHSGVSFLLLGNYGGRLIDRGSIKLDEIDLVRSSFPNDHKEVLFMKSFGDGVKGVAKVRAYGKSKEGELEFRKFFMCVKAGKLLFDDPYGY